ncbi:MAG TPA: MFS transporter [Dehalococcoidia bacterium]|nr:MFS transporter [Dehalococcoidia bacterium]
MTDREGAGAAPPLFTLNFVRLCLGNLLFLASLFLLVPVLPLYVTSLGGTDGEVGLVVGAFTISALVMRLVVGRWLDQGWRRRRLLFAGVAVFFLAALLYPVTRAVTLLIGLRFVHGSGMAAYGTTSTALIADSVPAPRLGEAMGYYGVATTLGMAVAPAAGVLLYQSSGYLAAFAASGALVLLTGLVTLGIAEPAARRAKRVAWRDLFNRRAWLPFLLAVFSSLAFSVIVTYLPLLVEARRVGNAGLYFTVYSGVVLVVRVFSGRASDRLGRGIVIVPGLALLSLALLILVLMPTDLGFWASALVFGLGFGAASPALSALAVEVVPPSERGSAIATYTAGFEFGIGFGAIALGSLIESIGFVGTFLIAAAGPALGSVVYLIARRPGVRPSK